MANQQQIQILYTSRNIRKERDFMGGILVPRKNYVKGYFLIFHDDEQEIIIEKDTYSFDGFIDDLIEKKPIKRAEKGKIGFMLLNYLNCKSEMNIMNSCQIWDENSFRCYMYENYGEIPSEDFPLEMNKIFLISVHAFLSPPPIKSNPKKLLAAQLADFHAKYFHRLIHRSLPRFKDAPLTIEGGTIASKKDAVTLRIKRRKKEEKKRNKLIEKQKNLLDNGIQKYNQTIHALTSRNAEFIEIYDVPTPFHAMLAELYEIAGGNYYFNKCEECNDYFIHPRKKRYCRKCEKLGPTKRYREEKSNYVRERQKLYKRLTRRKIKMIEYEKERTKLREKYKIKEGPGRKKKNLLDD